ncbi:MAG: gamma-glutamyl-gamma-aminobutyrate hydrolase family protein [Bradymonadaceae bacterium]
MTVKPRIGISANILHMDPDRSLYDGRPLLYLEQSMGTWLMRAGARPYLIPFAPEGADVETTLDEMMAGMDGLVLHGGADVAPESYGSEPIEEAWSGDAVRDAYETELVEAALDRDRPVLGVCRGLQLINVALGGTLYQDIATQVDGAISHRDRDRYDDHTHAVAFEPGARLRSIYGGAEGGEAISVHHQAIRELGDELVVEARSPEDEIVEAVRLERPNRYVFGVQWHPEFQETDDDDLLGAMPVLEDFLAAVEARARR